MLEFDTHSRDRPSGFCWCGEDSVAAAWERRGLLLVSPFCDFLRLDVDAAGGPLFLRQELDSLRVYSRSSHVLVRAVPPSVFNVFAPGAQTPGAVLRACFARFAQRAGERDMGEGVGQLRGEALRDAVRECVDAACDELSTLRQEELLRAASYGKKYWDVARNAGQLGEENPGVFSENQNSGVFSENQNSGVFSENHNAGISSEHQNGESHTSTQTTEIQNSTQTQEIQNSTQTPEGQNSGLFSAPPASDPLSSGEVGSPARSGQLVDLEAVSSRLRVLNALRREGGLFLTAAQLRALSLRGAVARLLARRRFFLAAQLCASCGLPRARVVSAWACAKVRAAAALSDAELFDLVAQRLAADDDAGFAQAAWAAHAAERPLLAQRFLARQRRAQDRVPLCLAMGDEAAALREAGDARDADVMLFAAVQLWKRCVFGEAAMCRWTSGALPDDRFASLMAGAPEIADVLEEYLEACGEDVERLLRAEGRLDARLALHRQNRRALRTRAAPGVSKWRSGPANREFEADPGRSVGCGVGAEGFGLLE